MNGVVLLQALALALLDLIAAAPWLSAAFAGFAICITMCSLEAFAAGGWKRTPWGWKSTGWAIAAASFFAIALAIAQAEPSSAAMGIGPS